MIVGVPKETKSDEYRVGLLPVGAHLLTADGQEVLVETDAGVGSGFTDEMYIEAGAKIVDSAGDVFDQSDMVIKVKEPQSPEIEMIRPGQVLFTYFHFAADEALTQGCLESKVSAVAYETLNDSDGTLPLLTPMSEVAGKLSIQEGAKYLEKPMLGRGILLGGVSGVQPGNVLILGGGVVGSNAARMAAGLGANVTIMDINLGRMRYLDDVMPSNVTTVYSDPHEIERLALEADLIVGAVLIVGDRAPKLLPKGLLSQMKEGAVVVDVSIDQGGCLETARPTTHKDPIYIIDGVVHYCVANMPGAVARTSTRALCNATLPYARELASKGVDEFCAMTPGRANALNMRDGKITNAPVAQAFPNMSSAVG